jgi:hypothetical protein
MRKAENMTVLLVRKLGCALVVGTVALVASTSNSQTKEKHAAKNHRTVQKRQVTTCLVRFGGSAFPEPCDRLGEMPATAEPMHIIGKLPTARDAR